MASNDLKQAVAREITEGHSISEIARRHGYTYRGMWGLVRTPEVQGLVARDRDRLAELVERQRAQLVLVGGRAVENIQRVVENPTHPDHVGVSRWLLDKLLPGKSQVQVEVGPSLSEETARAFAESMKSLREMRERSGPVRFDPSHDPHFLTGEQAPDRKLPTLPAKASS